MKDLSRAQSGLLLRLALALAPDSKDTAKPSREQPKGDRKTSQASATEPKCHNSEGLSEAAWNRLETLRTRFESELDFADSLVADDPPGPRVEMLLANSSELRKLAILQRFIERAYSFRLDQPRDGLRITDQVIAWTKAESSSLVSVIRGRAWMERGNFLRILGEPEGAFAALGQAAQELDSNGTSDPLEIARYQELLGTLERDCGNYGAAAHLLRKALAKVRRWGDSYSLQRILIAAALTDLYSDRYDEADALLNESLRAAEPDSLLLRFAAINKVLVLYFSGNPHKPIKRFSGFEAAWGLPGCMDFPKPSR